MPLYAAAATMAIARGLTWTAPSPTMAAALSPSFAGTGTEPVKAGTPRFQFLPIPSVDASRRSAWASTLLLSCASVVLQDAAKWLAKLPSGRAWLVNVLPPTVTEAGQVVSVDCFMPPWENSDSADTMPNVRPGG